MVKQIQNNLYTLFLVLFLSALSTEGSAQCVVTASANPLSIYCGDSINLAAVADGISQYSEDFDDNDMSGWANTPSGFIALDGATDCGKPTPQGNRFLWFGGSSTSPRYAETPVVNVITGGSLTFLMRYSANEGGANCENPDMPDEGVAVQYKVGAGPWITIQYWDPNGGADPVLTTWTSYSVTIPAAAATANTSFRWLQTNNTGDALTGWLDHWGIDDVKVIKNQPSSKYIWQHTGDTLATGNTPRVKPTANTTYTVTYTNGVSTCTSNISVSVLMPTALASVSPAYLCNGAPVQLDVASSMKANPPTSCSVNATAACAPYSTQADEKTLGTGTHSYGYNTGYAPGNPFGGFGDAYNTTHILYRASDLLAAGITAGQINNLGFNIQRCEANGGNVASITYAEVKIDMGCTSVNAMTNFGNPAVSFSNVYNPQAHTFTAGWHYFNFNRSYNWDGVQNIVIRICWRTNTGGSSTGTYAFTFNSNASVGYNCLFQSGSNFEAGQCATGGSTALYNRRPNTLFGFCKPSTIPLEYEWNSNPSGFTSTTRNPVANPTASTTYTVSVSQDNAPAACAATSSVIVTTVKPLAAATANPVNVCPPGTPNTSLDAQASTQGLASGSFTFNSPAGALAFADASTTGATKTINVSGINPNNLATNPVVSVCVNISMNAGSGVGTDCGTRQLKITLTSPGATSSVIYNLANNGAALNGCFTANYALAAPFPAAGILNGNWTVKAEDVTNATCGAATRNSPGGVFNSCSITFNTSGTNGIVSYNWAPTANLDNPKAQFPVATPTANATYTVTATDAMGCTVTSNVEVNYCPAAVPLNLLDFIGIKKDEGVQLSWTVAIEKNTSHFIVERSLNGIDFQDIGRVEASKNTFNIKKYSFIDFSPSKGNNYYRLRNYDLSGDYNHSKTVSVSLQAQVLVEIISISPVPAKDKIAFSLHSENEGNITAYIYDVRGRKLMEKQLMLNKGETLIEEDVSGLSPGIYLVKLLTEDGKAVIRRFIK